jgi:hypothetical protein
MENRLKNNGGNQVSQEISKFSAAAGSTGVAPPKLLPFAGCVVMAGSGHFPLAAIAGLLVQYNLPALVLATA